MHNRVDRQQLQTDLRLPWLLVAVMAVMLLVSVTICQTQGESLQYALPDALSDSRRELIRTLLYSVAIVTFPFTNLLRHIQLRLNQTMPIGQVAYDKAAKNRYLVTVLVSMSLIQSPGIYGFVMFLLGDQFNTLTIFTLMSVLGLYLYRPKLDEYTQIMDALANQHHE
ncbi:MAG: hypothetical protein PHH59_06110 [Methylovulum sp.]|uniref:hypothetical protein n=1 Tax=Methylovulum sp. TaxID=1916980 RepID=UPI002637D08F|nr:hypothetical protein [Methylovulum sp.]MDD2723579.1 hypothetical protein [Methylovulum sp.]MDD5126065.1 hypothetical protein [Methylovulum sp.]